MKKLLAILLSMMVVAVAVGCTKNDEEASKGNEESLSQEEKEPEEKKGGLVGMANPFADHESLEDAENALGFGISLPELEGEKHIRTMNEEMLEIIFIENEGKSTIRKAKGAEDISGNYESFSMEKNEELEGKSITIKGNDGKFSLALWQDGEFSYSIDLADGVSEEEILGLAVSIK